jgi:hypothetical protein
MDVDVLVSSTSAPHFLMTVAKLEPIMHRRRQRPVFIIDLAMPRDVEPAVHELDGVYLYDLDSLEVIAAKGLEARKREADLGEQLVLRHVRDFSEWLERASSAWPEAGPRGDGRVPASVVRLWRGTRRSALAIAQNPVSGRLFSRQSFPAAAPCRGLLKRSLSAMAGVMVESVPKRTVRRGSQPYCGAFACSSRSSAFARFASTLAW